MRRDYAAVVSSALLVWCSVWAGPAIMLEPATFDWGRQTENKGEYAFTFTVKNGGDEDLQISRVRPGCSCTKVELKKQTLAPGAATDMTGVLSTKGVEGAMQKNIILSTNDPLRPTVVANLAIRFPINGQGLRLRVTPTPARWRQDALWAYVLLENCEPDKPIQIEAMELPAGWENPQTLPLALPPESRLSLVLTRPFGTSAAPQAFEGLPFTLVTDSEKTPRVQGTLAYRPETGGTTVGTPADQPAAGTAVLPARPPVAKPEPQRAPSTTPAAPPPAPAADAPAVPAAAGATPAAAPTATPAR